MITTETGKSPFGRISCFSFFYITLFAPYKIGVKYLWRAGPLILRTADLADHKYFTTLVVVLFVEKYKAITNFIVLAITLLPYFFSFTIDFSTAQQPKSGVKRGERPCPHWWTARPLFTPLYSYCLLNPPNHPSEKGVQSTALFSGVARSKTPTSFDRLQR